jgi:threonine aldolase
MLGGGMRQAGIIAAAGVMALETMIDRLAEDHTNAKRLAQGLSRIPGITLAQENVETNIVMFDLSPDIPVADFISRLAAKGVKVGSRGGNLFRAVTHRMISGEDIDEALARTEAVCRKL